MIIPSATLRGSIVGGGDGSEPFLASRVPDLEFHRLFIDLYGAKAKVDADGGDVGFREGVVCEAEEEAGLSDA